MNTLIRSRSPPDLEAERVMLWTNETQKKTTPGGEAAGVMRDKFDETLVRDEVDL